MPKSPQIHWNRISAEAVAVVGSILLAFGIQAWWDERNQEEQRQGHLSALIRDFEQMSKRATVSFDTADRAVQSGSTLLTRLVTGQELNNATAMQQIMDINYYEVFSPSVGGYESLVNSGGIELLESNELKIELAAFYGSFNDTKASEQMLVNTLGQLLRSPEYSRLVGVHRLPVAKWPINKPAPVEEWKDSEFILSSIALVIMGQSDVLDDYRYLLERINSIREAIEEEANAN